MDPNFYIFCYSCTNDDDDDVNLEQKIISARAACFLFCKEIVMVMMVMIETAMMIQMMVMIMTI